MSVEASIDGNFVCFAHEQGMGDSILSNDIAGGVDLLGNPITASAPQLGAQHPTFERRT